jgi:hypothetical protein
MRKPKPKNLPNGMSVEVQEVTESTSGCYIGICCTLPPNRTGTGIRLPVNNGADFTHRLQKRSQNYNVSGMFYGGRGPGTWSPCINGCFGVVYNGKQRTVSESLLAIVFNRAVRACTFMEFENL